MKLTVMDWRNRAAECLTAARRAATPQDKVQWLILHDAWREFADLRERGQAVFEKTAVSVPARASAGRSGAGVDNGNRLRVRLRLVTNDDAG